MKANFQARFLTYCIDYIFSLGLSLIAVLLLGFKIPFAAYLSYFLTPIQLYMMVFYLIYVAICYIFFKGVSLGGLICNVKVVNEDGTNMKFGIALMRSALQALLPLGLFNVPYMLIYRTQISLFDACTNCKTIKLRNRD